MYHELDIAFQNMKEGKLNRQMTIAGGKTEMDFNILSTFFLCTRAVQIKYFSSAFNY